MDQGLETSQRRGDGSVEPATMIFELATRPLRTQKSRLFLAHSGAIGGARAGLNTFIRYSFCS